MKNFLRRRCFYRPSPCGADPAASARQALRAAQES